MQPETHANMIASVLADLGLDRLIIDEAARALDEDGDALRAVLENVRTLDTSLAIIEDAASDDAVEIAGRAATMAVYAVMLVIAAITGRDAAAADTWLVHWLQLRVTMH